MYSNASLYTPPMGGIHIYSASPQDEPSPPTLAVWDALIPLQASQELPVHSLDEEQGCACFRVQPGGRLLVNLEIVNGRAASLASLPDATWVDISQQRANLHAFSACFMGLQSCSPNGELEPPVILALVEFEGLPVLLASRLEGVTVEEMSDRWVGMPVRPQFSTINPLESPDLYFVPV